MVLECRSGATAAARRAAIRVSVTRKRCTPLRIDAAHQVPTPRSTKGLRHNVSCRSFGIRIYAVSFWCQTVDSKEPANGTHVWLMVELGRSNHQGGTVATSPATKP
jgi:hypothetical protein